MAVSIADMRKASRKKISDVKVEKGRGLLDRILKGKPETKRMSKMSESQRTRYSKNRPGGMGKMRKRDEKKMPLDGSLGALRRREGNILKSKESRKAQQEGEDYVGRVVKESKIPKKKPQGITDQVDKFRPKGKGDPPKDDKKDEKKGEGFVKLGARAVLGGLENVSRNKQKRHQDAMNIYQDRLNTQSRMDRALANIANSAANIRL